MGFFIDLLKNILDVCLENTPDDAFKNVSDDELESEYEKKRQNWIKSGYGGNGEKTPEMRRIENEMNKRESLKQKTNPHRNKDKNFRWTDTNRWEKD